MTITLARTLARRDRDGLAHPGLEEWKAWRAARSARSPVPGVPVAGGWALYEPALSPTPRRAPQAPASGRPLVLAAIDSCSPTQRAALLAPLHLLAASGVPVAALAPAALAGRLVQHGLVRSGAPGRVSLAELHPAALLAVTHAGGAGGLAWSQLAGRGVVVAVVQHGVLTPFAPPLPPGALLFCWSAADANFWSGLRDDVEVVAVGSQLLFEASRRRARRVGAPGYRRFLGQLHGPELPRLLTLETVTALAGAGPLAYRPHPDEVDAASLAAHRRLAARGIVIEPGAQPLGGDGAVLAIFSTGILEAAAGGLDAYAACHRPPAWVRDVWSRYAMAELGAGAPTAVELPEIEPAARIAAELAQRVGER